MNLLQDIITYVRRLVKSPSNAQITDNLIIDYINRFWLMDVDARLQLFDLKTNYTFSTIPGIATYNMPLYTIQTEGTAPNQATINYYPVYQGFLQPSYVNGIQVPFYTEQSSFWNLWPNYVQFLNPAAVGNGTAGPYTINLAQFPAIPGHLDMTGIIESWQATSIAADPIFTTTVPQNPAGTNVIPFSSFDSGVWFTATDQTGNNMCVQDTGIFLSTGTNSNLYGLLISQQSTSPVATPGQYVTPNPYNYATFNTSGPMGSTGYTTTTNVVDYTSGVAYVTFPNAVPDGAPINAQSLFFQQGLPRAVLYFDNTLTIRPQPDISYVVSLTAYLTPAAFLQGSNSVQFAYMAEYIARGAARKILADTGDTEQFAFYEPLFIEQEILVWKRSQRQFTASRTATIFSDLQGQTNFNQIGAGN